MILVGNQRGGAKNLALHLLKDENDHVQVHELRGFASDNLMGALNESYAISRGTRCKQFLYSLSLNPPPNEQVSTADFEAAINRAELELGLSGQPRAIVFHEKAGAADGVPRRHAHAVWSRINAEQMKAIQLSHDHRKLMALSRELYLEHDWKMPRGFMASEERDPRQFTMEEWQQAKRAKRDVREIKTAIQDCWAVSDSRPAFMAALESRGFKLARGDKRGYVAVDMNGEPYAIARWVGIKSKDVKARLGELDDKFPSMETRMEEFSREITQRLRELREQENRKAAVERERAERERREFVERQRIERAEHAATLQRRWDREAAIRQERFSKGWRKLLDYVTGRQRRTREQNIAECELAAQRDRAEKDALIFRQLDERRILNERQQEARREIQHRKADLDRDIRARSEFMKAVTPDQSRDTSRPKETSRAPPEPSPSVRRDFAGASGSDGRKHDRDAQKEEFIRQSIAVGALDLFVDEDIDYAQRLNAAGVTTELVVIPGAFHGFDTLPIASKVTDRFYAAKLAALKGGLGLT